MKSVNRLFNVAALAFLFQQAEYDETEILFVEGTTKLIFIGVLAIHAPVGT